MAEQRGSVLFVQMNFTVLYITGSHPARLLFATTALLLCLHLESSYLETSQHLGQSLGM